ncbi:DUF402 domain-containing protein [Candidatus Acetothermia bacterium]|nr:DUF402 domain-containing protein [Candidatus Acetothermia bacterium]MBI3644119.1 DUF402 domain-containing protein [Candidatus Acetothermia bacterium]
MKIIETKIHLDGRREEFACDAVVLKPDVAIVNFIWNREKPLRDGPIYLPAGEIHTRAHFWRDRNYLIYKITLADGTLLGHRFDVCEKVQISREITWVDLLLDLWVEPSGQIHILDEDEMHESQTRGLLTQDNLQIISSTKEHLLKKYRQIIEELEE